MLDLSIIIVNFNTKKLLQQALASVFDSRIDPKKIEVFVVDNASTDGSREMVVANFPQVRLIKSPKNLGFAGGNNLALKKASGRYILLLNSDTKLHPETLAGMLSFMEHHPQAGVATCRLELANGQLDWACHRGFPTPLNSLFYFLHFEHLPLIKRVTGGYHLTWLPLNTTHQIDTPSGAFYFVRKEVIDAVGVLDEDYFMYGEDIDWSYRIKKAGYQIYFHPQYKTTHYKKQSGRAKIGDKAQIKKTQDDFFSTMKLFYQKHYFQRYPRWFTRLVFFAIDHLKPLKS